MRVKHVNTGRDFDEDFDEEFYEDLGGDFDEDELNESLSKLIKKHGAAAVKKFQKLKKRVEGSLRKGVRWEKVGHPAIYVLSKKQIKANKLRAQKMKGKKRKQKPKTDGQRKAQQRELDKLKDNMVERLSRVNSHSKLEEHKAYRELYDFITDNTSHTGLDLIESNKGKFNVEVFIESPVLKDNLKIKLMEEYGKGEFQLTDLPNDVVRVELNEYCILKEELLNDIETLTESSIALNRSTKLVEEFESEIERSVNLLEGLDVEELVAEGRTFLRKVEIIAYDDGRFGAVLENKIIKNKSLSVLISSIPFEK